MPAKSHSRSAAYLLPNPGPAALRHSKRLSGSIAQAISAEGGSLAFDRYMHMALYTPGLGYYSIGQPHFDMGGDFVTAPETGELFARVLARQCAEVLNQLGGGDIVELGAGSGALARYLIDELERLDTPWERYRILEPSPGLRERQRERLTEIAISQGPIEWLDQWPGSPWQGVLIANEVLDAMPVRCFCLRNEEVLERRVTFQNDRFSWAEIPADRHFASQVKQALGQPVETYPENYTSELTPRLAPWFKGLAEYFTHGAAFFIDYGDARSERYHPGRSAGTLRAFYRHHLLDDLFWYPGLCDLTADVDFSAVAAAAVASGFEVPGFTPQAQFLLGGGLEVVFSQSFALAEDLSTQLRLAQQVKRLTLPEEMGERFKVITLARGDVRQPSGFQLRDLRDRL